MRRIGTNGLIRNVGRALLPIAAVVLATLPARPVAAATIVVTSTADDLDDGPNGNCTLREALIAAASDAPTDGCAAGSGADTVEVPSGEYVLTIAGSGPNQPGPGFDIGTTITVVGAGADRTTVVSTGTTPAFLVTPSGSLFLRDLAVSATTFPIVSDGNLDIAGCVFDPVVGGIVSHGSLAVRDSTFHVVLERGIDHDGGRAVIVRTTLSGEAAYPYTVGIQNAGDMEVSESLVVGMTSTATFGACSGIINGGSLVIRHTTLVDNVCSEGGAIYNVGGYVRIVDSHISRNLARVAGLTPGDGGGISSIGGRLEIERSEISDNRAEGRGGGIYAEQAELSVVDSSVARNVATGTFGGGGIAVSGGTVTIDGSRITANEGLASTGGLLLNPQTIPRARVRSTTFDGNVGSTGGAIYLGGDPRIENCTFARNEASRGGAMFVEAGRPSISFSTFAENEASYAGAAVYVSAGNVRWLGSLVSGGCAARMGTSKVFQSAGANVEGPGMTCGFEQKDDRVRIRDLKLGSFTADGDDPAIYPLLPGSPAIDSVPRGRSCPATDERGTARPRDGNRDGLARCDAGAIER